MDLSLVTGLVSEQHLQRARPSIWSDCERKRRLELVEVPPRRQMWAICAGCLSAAAPGPAAAGLDAAGLLGEVTR